MSRCRSNNHHIYQLYRKMSLGFIIWVSLTFESLWINFYNIFLINFLNLLLLILFFMLHEIFFISLLYLLYWLWYLIIKSLSWSCFFVIFLWLSFSLLYTCLLIFNQVFHDICMSSCPGSCCLQFWRLWRFRRSIPV